MNFYDIMNLEAVVFDRFYQCFFHKGGFTMDNTLTLLKQMAHGIAAQFGTSCEVVIHDLNKDLETSIVHIENGQVTHRKSGDGPSGIVLETLHKNTAKVQDKLSYLTRTEDGRILKSSTLYIRDGAGKISYIFSINYDITALLTVNNALESLLHTEQESDIRTVREPLEPQTITHNVEELLEDLMQQGLALIGKPVALMTKEDKIQVVRYLNDAGAFLITRSGDKVANLLNISKFTLYSYMDAGK